MIKDFYRFLSRKYQNVFLDYPVNMTPRYIDGPHPELNAIVNENRDEIKSLIHSFSSYFGDLQAIPFDFDPSNRALPHWNNDFLPGMDIAVIFGMIAHYKPSKYLEVGSGNSTKVVHLAKQKYSPNTEIISIDPMPRAEIDQLANKIVRKPFEDIDLNQILSLEAGDVLFIDNSHRVLPNSDATVFFLEVLPRLKKGVIVHIHDIYIPFDYPQFMCDRAYSEQYMLAAFLLANSQKYRVLFPNFFVSTDQELASGFTELWQKPELKGVEQHGGSFWLQIN